MPATTWTKFRSLYSGRESELSQDWFEADIIRDLEGDNYEEDFARQVNVVSSTFDDGTWSVVSFGLNAKHGEPYLGRIGRMWHVRATRITQDIPWSEVWRDKCPISVEFKKYGSGGEIHEIMVGRPKRTAMWDGGPGPEELLYSDIICMGQIIEFFKGLPCGTYRPEDKRILAHGAARLAMAAHSRRGQPTRDLSKRSNGSSASEEKPCPSEGSSSSKSALSQKPSEEADGSS